MSFNTGNDLPSLDERDLYDNATNLDKAMNSTDPTWTDRFGVEKPTIDAALKSAGFMPAGFDFVTGGTLQPGDRNKAVYNPAPNGDNNWYRWNGVFPKEIVANSQPNPKDENNWVPVIIKTGVVEREALRRTYQEVGLNLVEGSFEQGAVITSTTDVVLHEKTGKCYSGPIGNVPKGTDPENNIYKNISTTGYVTALTNLFTIASMGILDSLNLNVINNTTFSDCVLDFGMIPVTLTSSLTLRLNNVLVRGLVLRPTAYSVLKITGTNYHLTNNILSGIDTDKNYFDKTDFESPMFIALQLEGTGFSFKHNIISEYVSRQGLLVTNARDFYVSGNRVINCWSHKRNKIGGTFDNYGDGIYIGNSVNGFVDNNIVENGLANPIGRAGIVVEFDCKNIKVHDNFIQGYDRGLHVELVEDNIELRSNTIRGCNFPIVAWNCKTANVKFLGNNITTEGIVSSNPQHAAILTYSVKAHIMSLGDYVEEYSNNSGVVFENNFITTVDGTNTPGLIYSENALDVKFNSNKHLRRNTTHPIISIGSDDLARTYYANFKDNVFDANIALNHLDVINVRNNQFNLLSIFFKRKINLTRSDIKYRNLSNNTYKTGTTSGGILMNGEAETYIEKNTIMMGAFDYLFHHLAKHVINNNNFVRAEAQGFDPKLILTSNRYAQGGAGALLSGNGNVFIDTVCKYNFIVTGAGVIETNTHQQTTGMTKPPQFAAGGTIYDPILLKPVFCKRRGFKTTTTWNSSTSYSLGAVHLLNGVVYQCIEPGVSGTSIPEFNITEGNLTTDNTVVWCSRGLESLWIDATGANI